MESLCRVEMEELSLLYLQLPLSCVEKQLFKGLRPCTTGMESLSNNVLLVQQQQWCRFTCWVVCLWMLSVTTPAQTFWLPSSVQLPAQCGLYKITRIVWSAWMFFSPYNVGVGRALKTLPSEKVLRGQEFTFYEQYWARKSFWRYMSSCMLKKWKKTLSKFYCQQAYRKMFAKCWAFCLFCLAIWLFHFLCFITPHLDSWTVYHQCVSKEQ